MKVDQDKLFSLKEAAIYLGFSESTLRNWKTKGVGPTFFKLGRIIRYKKEDLDNYLKQNLIKGN